MNITTLVLCDAASSREGLLHVLGGGITFIRRPSFPAPLLCDIGLVLTHKNSITSQLSIKIVLRKEGASQPLTEITAEAVPSPRPENEPMTYGSVALPLDARALAVPGPGDYSITASVKGGKGQTVYFTAIEDPSAQQVIQVPV